VSDAVRTSSKRLRRLVRAARAAAQRAQGTALPFGKIPGLGSLSRRLVRQAKRLARLLREDESAWVSIVADHTDPKRSLKE